MELGHGGRRGNNWIPLTCGMLLGVIHCVLMIEGYAMYAAGIDLLVNFIGRRRL